jgi:hypothetical protein
MYLAVFADKFDLILAMCMPRTEGIRNDTGGATYPAAKDLRATLTKEFLSGVAADDLGGRVNIHNPHLLTDNENSIGDGVESRFQKLRSIIHCRQFLF